MESRVESDPTEKATGNREDFIFTFMSYELNKYLEDELLHALSTVFHSISGAKTAWQYLEFPR